MHRCGTQRPSTPLLVASVWPFGDRLYECGVCGRRAWSRGTGYLTSWAREEFEAAGRRRRLHRYDPPRPITSGTETHRAGSTLQRAA
jgi:hypothetical protein